MKLKIAFLQLLAEETMEKQLTKGIDACRKAKAQGADIALFPEMWSCGYNFPLNKEEACKLCVSLESDFVRKFAELSAELNMAIAITFLGEGLTNSVALFDRHGELIYHYSKVHTCDFAEEKILKAGEDFYVADLDTEGGVVRVGSMICFDREFPESARILTLKGAELILAPNACPMEINRLSALRTRAYENSVAVATCNYPEGQPDCNGHSTLFDGVAWLRDEPGVRDMCVFNAPGEEGIYEAELDMDLLRKYRAGEATGDTYRRPDAYSVLTSDKNYIETERLFIVPMRMKYLWSTHEYASDPENTKYMVNLPNDSFEETRGFIRYAEEEWKKADPQFFEYAILMDGHVGGISIYPDQEDKTKAELGWTVNKKYWRQGICSEAALGIIKHAREKLGIKTFIAHCDSENVASYKVMEKIGMTKIDEYGGRYNKQSPEERRECLYELKF
ncbi:MAG: GNAT family N-acetyltransferase [Saccharofermentans sp.]|nr:GNAT family N-acetyltransferase [Saccharofermentans sp.]